MIEAITVALEALLSGQFFQSLIRLILDTFMLLVWVLLLPIHALLESLIPDYTTYVSALSQYFDYASEYASWASSAFAVPSILINLVGLYLVFTFSMSTLVWAIKIGVKWKKVF